jgi:hypothetical protein
MVPLVQGLTSAQLLAAASGASTCVILAFSVVHKLTLHHGAGPLPVSHVDAVHRLRYEATHLGIALLLGGAQLVRARVLSNIYSRELHGTRLGTSTSGDFGTGCFAVFVARGYAWGSPS